VRRHKKGNQGAVNVEEFVASLRRDVAAKTAL